jgi:choline dehydrogenase
MNSPDQQGAPAIVIVGGGSAGAVLAARLSEDPSRAVVLLEAGRAYKPDDYPQVLLNSARLADADHDWGYTARVNDQTPPIIAPRGRALGGSSAVNAAVAIRARAGDFDSWAAHGVEGWSFDEVIDTFKELENTPDGDDEFHGRSGPLAIRQHSDEELTPSLKAFIDACVYHGFPRVHDFNGAEQNGVDGVPLNVLDGVRQNTGLAYLTEEVRNRPNLTIIGDVHVDTVRFDGSHATGVVAADGTVYPAGEVILSAGSYGTPAILLRSGVGPAAELAALGIDVVADLPVGQHLQDQPIYATAYALSPRALEMTPAAGGLLWTASRDATADELDLHIASSHLIDGSYSPTGGAIALAVAVVLPDSYGTVRLASRDPKEAPVIDLNLLSTARDRRRMLDGVKLARAIARNEVFAPFVTAELIPGDAVTSDEALAHAIQSNLNAYGHPTSTAPMGGPDDPWAVVDALGAVKGVAGLRVVDTSIIPQVPSAPTNLTTIMLAEHIAKRVHRVDVSC